MSCIAEFLTTSKLPYNPDAFQQVKILFDWRYALINKKTYRKPDGGILEVDVKRFCSFN
jgi:hypothetical protein